MRAISEPETEFITADDYREEPNGLEETDAFLKSRIHQKNSLSAKMTEHGP